MAKVVCVLYDDPVDGYPTKYARDGLPKLDRYPAARRFPRRRPLTLNQGSCSAACPANSGYGNFSKTRGTAWL